MSGRVRLIARLPFGEGQIGAAGFSLDSLADQQAFSEQLKDHIQLLSNSKTADCVDGRKIIALADGTTDPRLLIARVVPQLPGGLGLATTKAAVGANLALIRDAKSFQAAYETIHDLLTIAGYQDAAHVDCGASKNVEASVAKQLPSEVMLGTLPTLRSQAVHVGTLLAQNWQTKSHRLEAGFYGQWSSSWHEDFVSSKSPDNFSILETDTTPTHGHSEQALIVIRDESKGLAKNSFIADSGEQVFGLTAQTPALLIKDLAKTLTVSQREMKRFLLEFDVDGPQVLNCLTAQGIPVFA